VAQPKVEIDAAELAQLRAKAAAADVERNALRDWYIYSSGLILFGNTNTSLPVNISIQADADFICAYITVVNSDATGFTIQISDQGSQRKLSNVPLRFDQVGGTAQRPYVLPMPHRFPRNGAALLDTVNLGANASTARVDLHGYKVWASPARM
jgi:hypothetical protein